MLTPQDVYRQTRDGLDIILRYYPQAEPGVDRKNFKFRIRTEAQDPSPSSVIKHYNGVWRVTDFGSGDKAMDGIAVVMKEENCDFGEAMKLIATQFNLVDESGNEAVKLGPDIRVEPAKPDQPDGTTWETQDFSMTELQGIFSRNIWAYLAKALNTPADKPGDELAMINALAICQRYKFFSLASYTTVKKGKATTIRSTSLFPIFMFNEGTWQKLYKPREREAQYRFFSIGQKPDNYVFGLSQATERLGELQKDDKPGNSGESDEEKEEPDDESGSRASKLPELIMTSGGSDALNVAAMGYYPIWFNSETIDPKTIPMRKLKRMAERIYNLPDLDATGRKKAHELAMEYLDVYTIWLPTELGARRDLKGKVCKDVRDYFTYYATAEFSGLIKLALPYRFWDVEAKKDRKGSIIKKYGRIQYEYKPNNRRLYNFLLRVGFGKFPVPNTKEGEILIQRIGNIVHSVEYKHVRRYIEHFLESRQSSEDLFNAFYRSDQVGNTSLENIKMLRLDFADFGRDFQYLFFENEVWKVTAKAVEQVPYDKCDHITWADKVIQHKVKRLDPYFAITQHPETGDLDIAITDKSCLFFRYLINTSRIHWKKELEEEVANHSLDFQEGYLAKHTWSIDGSLLTTDEIGEQKQHLINKICSIGYLLHKYKDPSTAFCVWAMDYNMQNVGQSFGGTGKSLAYDNLKRLIRQDYHNGRNEKLTENQFIFARVTEHMDYVFIDDAYEYFNFRFFFSMITGSMECVAKGVDAWVLSNEKSPKLCVTSNFPPRDTDSATQRRIWFTAFADYYHKNPNGEYREERDPKTEFGKALFTEFTPHEWNMALNFFAQALQAWLRFGKVDPPMATVMENTYRNKMGQAFHGWADVFFAEDNGRLNAYVQKIFAYETYKAEIDNRLTANSFKDKLSYWCLYNGFIFCPKELQNPKQKRILKKGYKLEKKQGQWQKGNDQETLEWIYIQTPGCELTSNGLDKDAIEPGF